MARGFTLALMIILSGAAFAADDIEAVYAKLHAAALAKNVDEMMKYATDARRNELETVPDKDAVVALMTAMIPKTYRVTGRAFSPDGNAAQMRASGIGGMVGMGEALMYAQIDFAREKGEWKVDKWSWSSDRPAAAPAGFVRTQDARSTAEPQVPKTQAKPKAAAEPQPAAEAREPARVMTAEKTKPAPCVVKPVMTDDDLKACGAHVTSQ